MTHARDTSLVRKRREELGMRLVDLAADTSISPALVSMIEGGFVPKLHTMALIAKALGAHPLDLWPAEIEEITE